MQRVISIFLVMIVISCTTKQDKEKPLVKEELVEKENKSGYESVGDSLLIPSFEIEIDLDKKAAAKLADQKETIIVSLSLFGEPKEGVTKSVNEMGELYLASPQLELKEPGIAKFENVKISKQAYESLADKDFTILVNVFSGRRSSENNLLTCDILQEPVSKVIGEKHKLKGKLIFE